MTYIMRNPADIKKDAEKLKENKMQPLDSYQSVVAPEHDKRDLMIESALEEFHETGECLNDEVKRDDIFDLDMIDTAIFLLGQCVDGRLCFNDIERVRAELHKHLMSRVEEEVDNILFDEEEKRAGL